MTVLGAAYDWLAASNAIDWLIVAGYVIGAYLVFDLGTAAHLHWTYRAHYALLGAALICFGTGRFLYEINGTAPPWLFWLGHIALLAYAAVLHHIGREVLRRGRIKERRTA